jgi:glycosyltransferase involved in cell wall biosynthesis
LNPRPSVSVVIPTRARAALVVRAVNSVLGQTVADLEVIVVIDGPDPETVAALEAIASRRLKILALPQQGGGARARNAGVKAATGEWLAFLDDDDEWVPGKLGRQLAVAKASSARHPIVACQVRARMKRGEFIWPRKPPSEPLSEYLLARNSWRQGEGVLQTSTLLTTRSLVLEVPFAEGLRKHQDWDWLLRATLAPGVKIEFVPQPLATWNLEPSPVSVSRSHDWQGSLAWIRERHSLVTPRAYAGFIATQVASQAARQGQWRAFLPLLAEMFQIGRPRVIDVLLFLGMWVVPPALRERGRVS